MNEKDVNMNDLHGINGNIGDLNEANEGNGNLKTRHDPPTRPTAASLAIQIDAPNDADVPWQQHHFDHAAMVS